MKTNKELLSDANSIIRSFKSVIERQGKDTNWEGLNIQVARILKEQHAVLYSQSAPVKEAQEVIWYDINELIPQTGVMVLCKLSKDIGIGTTTKKLYRMKYNGKWNDYDNLVTHWSKLGKNKIVVSDSIKQQPIDKESDLRSELIKFAQQFYADEETCIHNVNEYLKSK
jgi:hypothetical protein